MNRLSLITIVLVIFSAIGASAQPPAPDARNRARWIQEIRSYKHDFMAKELDLSNEQQRKFFPVFDAMEDEVERINTETRELEARADNPEASALELENIARTIFEQKRAEGQVEMTYFEKFKEILSPAQLVKLKSVERQFNYNLVKAHRQTKRNHDPQQRTKRNQE